MESFSTTLLIGAGVGGIIAWTLIAIYAFWRVGDARDEAKRFADRSRLLELALISDYRRPIWLWPDESLSLDDETAKMLGHDGPVQTLSQLGKASNIAFDLTVVDSLKKALGSSRVLADPITLSRPGQADILMELEPLDSDEEGWPVAILWVEEMHTESFGSGVYGLERAVRALQKFIDAVPYPVWQRDRDFNLVRVNKAYIEAVGAKTAEEVLTTKLELGSGFTEVQKTTARKKLRSGEVVKDRSRTIINNEPKTLAYTTVPMAKEQSYVGVAVDVSGEEDAINELNRVLEAQTETLHRLRSPVAIFGPDKHLRFFNNAFQRYAQLDEQWLSRQPSHGTLLDRLRDNQRAPEASHYDDWKQNVLSFYTSLLEAREDIWNLPDGSSHRVLTQPHPSGGLQMVLEDVTDYLMLERSYNTLLAVQSEIIDSLFEAIIVFGSDGLLKFYNPAFLTLWGVEDSQFVGEIHYHDILELASEMQPNNPQWEKIKVDFDYWFTNRETKTGRLHTIGGPVLDYYVFPLSDGALMVRMMDVSSNVEKERRYQTRNDALEQIDRLRSEFILKMGHDLRVPLSTISGYTALMDEAELQLLSETQRAYLENIHSASEELTRLIDEIMDLGVIEGSAVLLHRRPFKFSALLDAAITNARARASEVGASITISLEEDVDDFFGDRDRMHRVLDNLYLNLLKFSRAGTLIDTSIKPLDGELVEICLTAFATKAKPSIWEEIKETVNAGLDADMQHEISLSLALLRSVVTLHKGQLQLEGSPQTGMIIRCILPRDEG